VGVAMVTPHRQVVGRCSSIFFKGRARIVAAAETGAHVMEAGRHYHGRGQVVHVLWHGFSINTKGQVTKVSDNHELH